jgi:serine protease inhibitor
MEKKEIEKIYGEDVVDLIYLLEKYNERDPESFLYITNDEKVIQIYFGDQDVVNSYVIFPKNRNVRAFSSEYYYKIIDLYELIKTLDKTFN